MSVLVDLSVFPMDKGVSVGPEVARAVAVIRESGLPFVLGPMGTTIEGEWDEVMAVAGRAVAAVAEGAERAYATMKIDYRKGPGGRIKSKIKTVEECLE